MFGCLSLHIAGRLTLYLADSLYMSVAKFLISLSALLEKLLPDLDVIVLLFLSFANGRLGPAALQTCRV